MLSIFLRLLFGFLCFVFGSVAKASCPASSMEKGWCWPTIRMNWSNELVWHGINSSFSGVHLGKDIDANENDLVYSVAKGTVLIVRNDVSYYGGAVCNPGPSSISGSGIVIRHYTSTGNAVDVLYAHIKNIRVSKGDIVESGKVLGEIRNYTWCGARMDHLHFGVAYPDRNMSLYDGSGSADVWAGYGSTDKGFVNPVEFFTSNSVGGFPVCDPMQEECQIKAYGNFGWYPPVMNCSQANQWFLLDSGQNIVGSGNISGCSQVPAACYP